MSQSKRSATVLQGTAKRLRDRAMRQKPKQRARGGLVWQWNSHAPSSQLRAPHPPTKSRQRFTRMISPRGKRNSGNCRACGLAGPLGRGRAQKSSHVRPIWPTSEAHLLFCESPKQRVNARTSSLHRQKVPAAAIAIRGLSGAGGFLFLVRKPVEAPCGLARALGARGAQRVDGMGWPVCRLRIVWS